MPLATQNISQEVQRAVLEAVSRFNASATRGFQAKYLARFRSPYLYLDRCDYGGHAQRICRLRCTGRFDGWEFAVFKYSSGRCDANDRWFPGAQHIDGTVEGVMRSGLEAYPP